MTDHSHEDSDGLERVTSPMQQYSTKQVGVGLAVLAIGLLLTFVIPIALI